MPSPLAMGIPGIVGAWVAVGMWIGSVIAQIWTWRAKENALLQVSSLHGLVLNLEPI